MEASTSTIPADAVSLQKSCEILGISISFVKKLIREKKVVTYKLGDRRTFISPGQVRSLLTVQSNTVNSERL